jgi:prepilin-type N-terminal cleavage/methylation domain-containing protein/prepilin-type processing-associated H-X9-DG protein
MEQHDGFTLVELLVTIAIVALLSSILLPVMFSAREKGRQISCISNQHQIMLAITIYTQEHNERLPDAGGIWTSLDISPKVLHCRDDARQANSYIYNALLSHKALAVVTHPERTLLTADGKATAGNVAASDADLAPRHQNQVVASFLDGHVSLSPPTGLFVGYAGIIACDGQAPNSNNRGIYIMNADGTAVTILTANTLDCGEPQLSARSDKIVFVIVKHYTDAEATSGIAMMDYNGTHITELTDPSIHQDCEPYFDVSGQKILFFRGDDGYVYSIDPSGANMKKFTPNGFRLYPTWYCTNGLHIVFATEQGNNPNEIYRMDIDGTNLVQLSTPGIESTQPSYSPDGKSVVFIEFGNANNLNIFTMNEFGSNMKQLTNDGYRNGNPAFSPTGRSIVYSSTRNGNNELFMMNSDGTNIHQFVNNLLNFSSPSWGE